MVNEPLTALGIWLKKWNEVDASLYFKEFKWPVLRVCVTFLAILFLFHAPVISFLKWGLVGPLLSSVPSTVAADRVCLFALLISVLFLVQNLSRHLLPSINSLVIGASVLLGYFIVQHYLYGYSPVHFHLRYLNALSYGTCFVVTMLSFVLTYKTYFYPLKKVPGQLAFVEDSSKIDQYQDVYNRQGFADTLFNHIMATSTQAAFVIGIIGDWGSGKTDLSERLKKKVQESTDNIILDFNAWRVNKADVMIESFFKSLSVKLRPYNYSIAGKIREYSKKILQPGKELQHRLMDAVIEEFLPAQDVQAQYESINEAIKSTGKRLVIFLDDTDRLSGKEVMEVLRLVRNTANFANTFFIVGMDHSYILSALTHSKEYANEAEYLKKIFQFTITLPAVKKDIFLQEVIELLETPDLSERDRKKIKGGLSRLSYKRNDLSVQLYEGAKVEELLEDLLENMRDVKRFVNSFKVAFNLVKDDADIHDLIVLELIRNKCVEVYNMIRSKDVIDYSMDKFVYLFNYEKWKELAVKKLHYLSVIDLANLKTAVEYLFNDPGYKTSRKILEAPNFYIYFSFQLFNQIPLREFNDLLTKDADAIVAGFNGWITDKKEADLLRIIGTLEVFRYTDTLQNMIAVYCRVTSTNPHWDLYAKQLFYSQRTSYFKQYFKNVGGYQQFIHRVMEDRSIPPIKRADLAYQFLYEIIKGEDKDTIFTKREWQRIVYSLFDQYLSGASRDIDEVLEFFRFNDYRRDGNWIILYPPAGRRLRRYLLANEAAFEHFTRKVIGQRANSDTGYFEIHLRLIKEVFSVPAYFRSLLEARTFVDKKAQKAREIILAHFDEYLVDEKAFFLPEFDRPE